jgi:toxin YoeB
LKGNLQGWWSRRIDDKHRLIYKIESEEEEEQEKIIVLASCYGHYNDK